MAKRSHRKSRPVATPQASPARSAAPVIPWPVFQALLVIVAGLVAFLPAVGGGWIGDDSLYLTDNALLRDPLRLYKAWFQPGSFVEYYPIEQTLQWIQWNLWHDDTFGYHVTNIVLHLVSAFLVWRLFSRLGLRWGWLGGLLFAVHPMTVDSVALVNEFKTCLSLPPFLLALIFWVDYEQGKNPRYYFLALGLFLIAMLCKITMMMFPFVIPLYAWWKRGRVAGSDLLAMLPFFAISLVLGYASVRSAQIFEPAHATSLGDPMAGQPLARGVLTGQILLFYFSHALLPVTPMPDYPLWNCDPTLPWNYLPWLVLLAMLGCFWAKRRTWGRHALLGLGFFFIMLAPFSGLRWIAYMKGTWVLDHLVYIPLLGLIGLVIAAADHLHTQVPDAIKKYAVAVMAVLIALMTWQSHVYAAQFIDEETLSRYELRHNPSDSVAYTHLGFDLMEKRRYSEAIDAYQTCLALYPKDADVQNSLGNVLGMIGNQPEAIEHFRLALNVEPQSAAMHANLANALQTIGQKSEAIDEYQQSIRLDPRNAGVYFDLALCLSGAGRDPEAVAQFQQALAVDPNLEPAHLALGKTLMRLGKKPEAVQQFEAAVQIDPTNPEARTLLRYAQESAN